MIDPLQIAQIMGQRIIQNQANQGNLPPWGADGLNAVMTGNAQKGEEIANRLLQTYGLTKEQAFEIANQRLQGLIQ